MAFTSWIKPTIHYCEPNLSGWIVQPANAVSSLFISLAGIYILTRKKHPYSAFLGAVAIILGIASFFYYLSNTFAGQLADLGSMYLLASILIVAGVRRYRFKMNSLLTVAVAVTLLLILLTAFTKTVHSFNVGIPIFGILLVIAIYEELESASLEKLNLRYYWLTFAAFIVGYLFWWLDYKKYWCSPNTAHYINGHALWHLFNAVAIISLDIYYSQIKNIRKIPKLQSS